MSEQQEKRCGDCAFWNKELAYCQLTITTRLSNDVGCEKHKTSYELDQEYRKKQEQARVEKEGELNPCPFCGCKSATIIDHEDGLGACDYYVACDRCSASGSFSDNLNDAVRKWNNRVINHGAWERRYMPSPHLECSECGYIVGCSDGSNYCPACGARMDKKDINTNKE